LLGQCGNATGSVDSAPSNESTSASATSSEDGFPADAGASYETTSHPAGSSASDVASDSCAQRERALYEQINTSYTQGDLSCESDRDCFFGPPEFSCYNGCNGWLVSRAGRSSTQAAVERDMAPFCSALSGCSRGIPSCNLGSRSAECSDGTCRIFDPSPFSCEQLGELATQRQKDLLDAAERSCTRDADCALFYEPPGCVYSCDLLASIVTSVAASSVPALQLAAQSLDAKYCSAWVYRPCQEPTIVSGCPVPEGEPRASCVAGACEVRYVTTP
jgi:hypothetical protein